MRLMAAKVAMLRELQSDVLALADRLSDAIDEVDGLTDYEVRPLMDAHSLAQRVVSAVQTIRDAEDG